MSAWENVGFAGVLIGLALTVCAYAAPQHAAIPLLAGGVATVIAGLLPFHPRG